jgi:hypothetical protein
MTAPALTRHRFARFMREHGCDFIRATTANNHELWRDRQSGKTLTVGPRVTHAGMIEQTLRQLRRQP